jgi:hypothetical protein
MLLRKLGPLFRHRRISQERSLGPRFFQLLAVGSVATCLSSLAVSQATKPAPATPIDVKKAELGGTPWNPAWDAVIEKNIPPEMLSMQVPHDVRKLCPRFYTMSDVDKRAFWAYFFQALAGAEAGLEPTARVHHKQPAVNQVDPVTGRLTRQEGLLQLSYHDQKRYGCDFDWESDKTLKPDDPNRTILQPEKNLECGIKILENQIIDQHKPLLSRSSYWSPLQPRTAPHKNFLKQMTNPPAACGEMPRSKVAKNKTTKTVKQEAENNQLASDKPVAK